MAITSFIKYFINILYRHYTYTVYNVMVSKNISAYNMAF